LATAEGRARAAESAMKVIAEHPSQLVRDQYLMEVADRCRVDVDSLRRMRVEPTRGIPERARIVRRAETPAHVVLRLAVQTPEDVGDLLHESLFVDDIDAAAFRALVSASTFHDAVEVAGPEAGELLQRLATEELVEVEAEDAVARLADDVAGRVLVDVEASARSAEDPLSAVETIRWIKLQREDLYEEHRRRAAIDELVAFFAERVEEGA